MVSRDMTFLNKPDLIKLPEMLKSKRGGKPPFFVRAGNQRCYKGQKIAG